MSTSTPRGQELDGEQAIARTMAAAEDLASTDWTHACCQMIALYPLANDHFMHDVCDSIDLWIFEEGLTVELVDHLRELISKEVDPGLKRHYQEWINSPESG